jgi:hypothetical protein
MRPKFRKQNVSEFVSWIIPYEQGDNIPFLGMKFGSKACFGVHTRERRLISGAPSEQEPEAP